jgi:hypothetical protein
VSTAPVKTLVPPMGAVPSNVCSESVGAQNEVDKEMPLVVVTTQQRDLGIGTCMHAL